MPLLGNQPLEEYAITLSDGEDLWTEYILAPSVEAAAQAAFKLSKDRDALLKDVIKTDDW